MGINHNHIYAKKKDNGEIISINDVENGLECNCVCTKCGSRLVAKGNQKNKFKKHNLSIGMFDNKTGISIIGYTYTIQLNE